jgi:hypothetical protein
LADRKKSPLPRIDEEMAGKIIKIKPVANFESASITSGKIKGSNKMPLFSIGFLFADIGTYLDINIYNERMSGRL